MKTKWISIKELQESRHSKAMSTLGWFLFGSRFNNIYRRSAIAILFYLEDNL